MVWYFVASAVAVGFAALSRAWNADRAKAAAAVSAGRHAVETGPPPQPPDRQWNLFDLLAVAVLVVFAASRYYVGTDWPMYLRYYTDITPQFWGLDAELAWSTQEFGYTTLEYGLKHVSDSPYLIFWVASILTIVPAYAVLKRFTSNLPLSVFFFVTLGFWVAPFNIVRQGIAMGLNFWAASRLDRSKTLFVVVNALAGLIHATAWIAAVIQLLTSRVRLNLQTAALALGGAVMAAGALASFSFLGQRLAALNPRYEASLVVDQSGLGTYLVIAVRLAILAFVAWRGIERGQARWFTWSVVGAAFLILGTQSVVLARMDFYFGIFLVLLLPAQLRKQDRPGFNTLVYVGAAVYFAMYLQNFGGLLPYQAYWSL